MRFFVFTILLLLVSWSYQQNFMFTAPQRSKSCSPTYSATSGNQKSLNYGKTWGLCTGFTCQSGYVVSNGSCIADVVANVSCNFAGGLCIANYAPINNLSLNSSVNTYIDILGCSDPIPMQITSKFNCPASFISAQFYNFSSGGTTGCNVSPWVMTFTDSTSPGVFNSNCTPVLN